MKLEKRKLSSPILSALPAVIAALLPAEVLAAGAVIEMPVHDSASVGATARNVEPAPMNEAESDSKFPSSGFRLEGAISARRKFGSIRKDSTSTRTMGLELDPGLAAQVYLSADGSAPVAQGYDVRFGHLGLVYETSGNDNSNNRFRIVPLSVEGVASRHPLAPMTR